MKVIEYVVLALTTSKLTFKARISETIAEGVLVVFKVSVNVPDVEGVLIVVGDSLICPCRTRTL